MAAVSLQRPVEFGENQFLAVFASMRLCILAGNSCQIRSSLWEKSKPPLNLRACLSYFPSYFTGQKNFVLLSISSVFVVPLFPRRSEYRPVFSAENNWILLLPDENTPEFLIRILSFFSFK
jgi:hypothetical protein